MKSKAMPTKTKKQIREEENAKKVKESVKKFYEKYKNIMTKLAYE